MNEMRKKTSNTKHQTPNKHQNPSPKLGPFFARVWNLVFGAYLVFGVWCLVFFGTNDASAQDTNPKAKPAEKILYENNFEKAEIGKVPDDLLVLEGAFVVQEESGNKFLELPGAPLGEG